jgi:alkylhydroperoxidase family enzyme
MSEIGLVGDDTLDPRLQAVYSRIRQQVGQVVPLYRVLANSPVLLEAWIDFAWTLRAHPKVARSVRELAILRIANITNARYETAAHTPMALAAGVTQDQIDHLDSWRNSTLFDQDERLVLEAAESLTKTVALDDDMRQRLLDRFGPEQTIEVVLTIAFYSCVSRVLRGLAVPMKDSQPDVGYPGQRAESTDPL